MKPLYTAMYIGLCLFAAACGGHTEPRPFESLEESLYDSLRDSRLMVSDEGIRRNIDALRLAEHDTTLIDAYTDRYYAGRGPYLWITRLGVDSRADSLLSYLNRIDREGVPKSRVYTIRLSEALHKMRNLAYDAPGDADRALATWEYYATKAYLRYVCGMRYGFVNPHKLFNRLDPENPDDSIPGRFRTLYDLPSPQPTRHILGHLIKTIGNGDLCKTLAQAFPSDLLYRQMRSRYNTLPDGYERRLLAVNMERRRWNANLPEGGKQVRVNIADFSLTAFDTKADTSFTMRICAGSTAHKTPLLASSIQRLEMNPVWVVPQSIIRREIAPRHAGDPEYFERNNLTITDRLTGEEVAPTGLSTEMLQSGNYRIQQAKGEGNSLGHLIFRFPNDFAIYLHDTPDRAGFERSRRGVSHGCIRLERPFDLAVFLLKEKDPLFIDRMRLAIGLPPITEKGKRLQDLPERKDVGMKSYKPPVPIIITYETVVPGPGGSLRYLHADPYGYDRLLWKQISQ